MNERFLEYRKELMRYLPYDLASAKDKIDLSFSGYVEGKNFSFKIFLPAVLGSLYVLSNLRSASNLLLAILVCVIWFVAVVFAVFAWADIKEKISERIFWLHEYDKIILDKIRQDARAERIAILNELFTVCPKSIDVLMEYQNRLNESEYFYRYCESHIDELNIPVHY